MLSLANYFVHFDLERSTRIPRNKKQRNKKQRKNHLDNEKQRKEIIAKLRSNWENSTK